MHSLTYNKKVNNDRGIKKGDIAVHFEKFKF